MKPQDFKSIENYFDNELSREEKAEVLKRVSVDPEFRECFYLHQAMLDGIYISAAREWTRKFRQWDHEKKGKPGITGHTNLFSKAAIGLILLASIFVTGKYLIPGPGNVQQSEVMFNHYFQPYSNTMYILDSINTFHEYYAYKLYNTGEYESAINIYSSLIELNPNNFYARLFRGLSYLNSGKTQHAISDLYFLYNYAPEEFPLNIQAKWYLALAYLKANEKENAEWILSESDILNSPYQEEARELLNNLNPG